MVFQSKIYKYVNTGQDPQLRYTVLAGLLNVSTCPNCGRRSTHTSPFIYSDPAHYLLIYVDPTPDISEDARRDTLEKLLSVRQKVGIEVSYRMPVKEKLRAGVEEHSTGVTTDRMQSRKEAPPLHVVFGLEQLHELINAALMQQERLGRLALRTFSRREAERGQLLDIARKFASEMQCQVNVEVVSGEYTVWLYGSRRQIGAIMRELAPQG
jgi:CpXC protein